MSEREINSLVLQRFDASGRLLRGCQIRNRVRRLRLRWNWELRRDTWLKRLFDMVFSFAVLSVFSPLFINVLLGDMSVVGPRPPVPREVALYTPAQRRRLAVKPGITCIWQVSGRSEIDFSGQVALDVRYIESQSLLTDLKIAVQTIPAVLSGRGAC